MVKVERTKVPPSSLAIEMRKKNGSYGKPDVIKQLKTDFHNKCYICELGNLQDPEIEHRLPHKNGKIKMRKFDWNNLFWCCGHCNGIKNQTKYEAGIIDCCSRDPEKVLSFELQECDILVNVLEPADLEANLTAELVTEVFNKRNTGMREIGSQLRLKSLQEEMNVLYKNLQRYKKQPDSQRILRTISALLGRESPFAAFKRCYIRMHIQEYAYIADICDI